METVFNFSISYLLIILGMISIPSNIQLFLLNILFVNNSATGFNEYQFFK